MRHVPDGSLLRKEYDFACDLERASYKSNQYDSLHWLFVPPRYDEYRFILGERGERPIICMGVNPSTAMPGKLDRTVIQVRNLSKQNGYDGFMMLNVCAQRATDPNDMERTDVKRLHEENLKAVEYVFSRYPDSEVWAAWGDLIAKRKYLVSYLREIQRIGHDNGMKWVCAGMTKNGNPRHPLLLRIGTEFVPFDVNGYLAKYC